MQSNMQNSQLQQVNQFHQYSYDRLYPWPYDYWSYEYRRPLTNTMATSGGGGGGGGGANSPISGGSSSSASSISPINSPLLFHKGDFMIRVFAQNLNQDVEYTTLHIDLKTTSFQVIENLFKKFRLKDLDPQKYYLTLERFIRKDGLKLKSVMLLNDDSCPLQMQQCCSNPPHKDIKFILQEKSGPFCRVNPSGALRYLSTASPMTSAIRERRQFRFNSTVASSTTTLPITTPPPPPATTATSSNAATATSAAISSNSSLSSSRSSSTSSASSSSRSSSSSSTGSTSDSPIGYSSGTLMQLQQQHQQQQEKKLAVHLESKTASHLLSAPPPLWFQ